jgi:hypothetical protein
MDREVGGGDFQGDSALKPHAKKNRAVQTAKIGLHLTRAAMPRQTSSAANEEYDRRNPLRSEMTKPEAIARNGSSNGRSWSIIHHSL